MKNSERGAIVEGTPGDEDWSSGSRPGRSWEASGGEAEEALWAEESNVGKTQRGKKLCKEDAGKALCKA